MQCEIKSSKTKKVSTWKNPWCGAVQFLNGTGDKFRIRTFYAKEWYKILPTLKNKFQLQSDIPSYDEWFKNDAGMGAAKTKFGVELHDMSRKNIKDLGNIKAEFVKNLIVPEKEVGELIEDYVRESKKVLDEKDCWLCICGNDVKLFDKIIGEDVKMITRVPSKDLMYRVESNIFNGIRVRWQNGCGIANISVQCT